jgi:hypothetical protein
MTIASLDADQRQLLRLVATGDHEQVVACLTDDGRWWTALRHLERAGLVTVAAVGPHRRPWPWVVCELSPLGRRRLTPDGE